MKMDPRPQVTGVMAIREPVAPEDPRPSRQGPSLCWFTAFGLLSLMTCGAAKAASSNEDTGPMPSEILKESWKAYVGHFIQQDGRVIDQKAGGISTSEGQAYAMLRSVWMDDRATFDKTYIWAVNNLNAGVRSDHLWAWKWGRDSIGKWRALDRAFATDADQDAALALILAYAAWHDPNYRRAAHAILADLWTLATARVRNRRYLLAGDSLCNGTICKVNPSYYAPYAYRIFAKYDDRRPWAKLVDSSYFFLESVSALTPTHLPPDWVYLDKATAVLKLGDNRDSSFSYDAFRVYWRVALDAELFKEPRADNYLRNTLSWITREWARRGKLPAVISSRGEPKAEYESLEMLAATMAGLRIVAPDVATAMSLRLQSTYARGVWADDKSYYLQNWAWFGTVLYQHYLAPFEKLSR